MSTSEYVETRYFPAYVPDPEKLEALKVSTDVTVSALGAQAVRTMQQHRYDVVRYDIVLSPEPPDPRLKGRDISGGYVGPDFTYTKHLIKALDANQTRLPEGFHAKHGFPEGTPLSNIFQHAHAIDDQGAHLMGKEAYMALLEDWSAIHTENARVFTEERLPGYLSSFPNTLRRAGLGRLIPKFEERMKQTGVVFDDGFSTLGRNAAGLYEQHHSTYHQITVAQGSEMSEEQRTVNHEIFHLLEGKSRNETFAQHPRISHAIQEGLAAHTSTYLQRKGDIQDITPNQKSRHDSYPTYRRVLDLFCNGGLQRISIHRFIDMNIADDGVDEELLATIKTNFPDHPHLLDEVQAQLEKLEWDGMAENGKEDLEVVAYFKEIAAHYEKARATKARRLRGFLHRLWKGPEYLLQPQNIY